MKRRGRKFELTSREKLSLLSIPILVLAGGAVHMWIHRETTTDRTEIISVPGDQDALLPVARLADQPALYLDFEGLPEPHRLVVIKQPQGGFQATFTVCRRCWSYGKPSRYSAGRLICGHCREGMPMLDPGEDLPREKDCTPVPVATQAADGILRIRRNDVLRGALEYGSQE